MSIIRKRRGNLIIAVLAFAIGIALIICGFFFGPSGKNVTYFTLAIGCFENVTFDNLGTAFKYMNINWVYMIAYAGPFVGSLIALLLRKFRLTNLINFCLFAFAIFIPSISYLLAGFSLPTTLKSFDQLYYILLGLQAGGLILSFLNLELCR